MKSTRGRSLRLGLVLALLSGCREDELPDCHFYDTCDAGLDAGFDAGADAGDAGFDAGSDAGTDAGQDAGDSSTCSGPPGLYVEGSCTTLASGVLRYRPRYQLWSDGADKARFVYLPSGQTIDTTNPDDWVFPVGTRLYKDFAFGSLRVETRMIEKVPGATVGDPPIWRYRTFAWNAAQDAVTEVTAGMTDVLGTQHDIPPVALCDDCHRAAEAPLGYGAIQLNHAVGPDHETNLAWLNAGARLDPAVDSASAVVPGNATESAALGYLHANCAHCHRDVGGAANASGNMRLFVRVADVSVADTLTYQETIGAQGAGVASGWMPAIDRVEPGSHITSAIYLRMSSRDFGTAMPPLATEAPDPVGLVSIQTWINALPVPPP